MSRLEKPEQPARPAHLVGKGGVSVFGPLVSSTQRVGSCTPLSHVGVWDLAASEE